MATEDPLTNFPADAHRPDIAVFSCKHRYRSIFCFGVMLLSFGLAAVSALLKLKIAFSILLVPVIPLFLCSALLNFWNCPCRIELNSVSKVSRQPTTRESWTLVSVLVGFIVVWVPMAIFKPTQFVCAFLMMCLLLFVGYKMVRFSASEGRLTK